MDNIAQLQQAMAAQGMGGDLQKGGVIAFDEARNKFNKDEGKAMIEFFKKNKNKYKLIKLNPNYQPDALLIKK